MFKCDRCNRTIGPNIKQEHHVIEERKQVYYNLRADETMFKTRGTEIVKEIKLCPICHANMQGVRFDPKKYWIGPKTVMPTMYGDDVVIPEKPVDNRRHLADE